MVYELDCEGTRFAVTMSEGGEPWQVAAGMCGEGMPPKLEATGKSRTDALLAVGEAWDRAGYARFDWDAIRQALAAVRAL